MNTAVGLSQEDALKLLQLGRQGEDKTFRDRAGPDHRPRPSLEVSFVTDAKPDGDIPPMDAGSQRVTTDKLRAKLANHGLNLDELTTILPSRIEKSEIVNREGGPKRRVTVSFDLAEVEAAAGTTLVAVDPDKALASRPPIRYS